MIKVINHGVSEKLMQDMIKASRSFFDITEEEKREYAGEHVFSPIRCGTSLHGTTTNGNLWRDYLRAFVHPDFHFPNKPPGLRYFHFIYNEVLSQINSFKGRNIPRYHVMSGDHNHLTHIIMGSLI